MAIAKKNNLLVIEDCAQGIMSSYKGKPLGSIGHMAALSFHETKNIISGEGGALLINDRRFVERAEIIWQKGTNRSSFLRGEVDKYTWVDIGSSYLPSELIAAYLWAQMEEADTITEHRLSAWVRYHKAFATLEFQGEIRRPIIPNDCKHNAHIYYLLFPNFETRSRILECLKSQGIGAIFHYIPLHSSKAGKHYGRANGNLSVTDQLSNRLLRLPLYSALTIDDQNSVIKEVLNSLRWPRSCGQ